MTTIAPFPNPFDDALRTIEFRIQSFISKARETVAGLWEWLANAVNGAINWVSERLNDFFTWVHNHVYGYGNVAALDGARDVWRDSISRVPNECARSINAEAVKTDNEWIGRGADAYNDRVPTQAQTLRDFSGTASNVASTLGDLSGATSGAITSTNVALGTLVIAAGAAVGAGVSIVAIPIAIGALIPAIGTALIALMAAYKIFSEAATRAADEMRSIANSDFSWPKITV